MGRLDGKVAIITGAGSGIGRAAAVLFAKEGAKVVVAEYVAETGRETTNIIKEAGGEALFIKVDVSKAEDVKNMVQTTVDTYRRLDILYNNAGIGIEKAPTEECSEDDWDRTLAVNLKGVWLGMKYAIPEMVKRGGGSIINTSSVCAFIAVPNEPAYNASKAGVVSLTRTTAIECAKKNIRVNSISPGLIATPALLKFGDEKLKEMIAGGAPIGRLGKPEEIAQVALFLASDESSLITGHSLVADGGWCADSHVSL